MSSTTAAAALRRLARRAAASPRLPGAPAPPRREPSWPPAAFAPRLGAHAAVPRAAPSRREFGRRFVDRGVPFAASRHTPPPGLGLAPSPTPRRFFTGGTRALGGSPPNAIDGASGADVDTSGERIVDLELSVEAEQSYLAYAMSVIVGRALPDVRDGLKPVHRRILYAMHELGLDSKKPFKKCARVVGEVLGKFHPHGDQSVYDALVRMAQDFSMSATLVDGHGNFGSLDADPPAAMRYTECRLRSVAEAMLLADISQDAVDFGETFDGSQTEPSVLPARLPNILINGSTGIAVGMATSIPPHNLREVAAALAAYASDPEGCTLDDLLAHMPAPDFPTGGEIIAPPGGFREMYRTGKGAVTLRGEATIERAKGSKTPRDAIVITSIPYQTNKASLCEHVADLVNSKVIEGVADVRDESDRDGMRVVIELRKSADANFVLTQLRERTKLQTKVSVNVVGLVGREPRVLTLLDIMREFLAFRRDAIRRRAKFELDKAAARLHVVEGYLAVRAAPDAVVAAIREAPDAKAAQLALQEKPFWLSETQAEAVLAMPLRRLTGLEHDKLRAEEAELSAKTADLADLLEDDARVIATVAEEAKALADRFGVDRRTAIDTAEAEAAEEAALLGEGGEGAGGGEVSRRAAELARLHAKRHGVAVESLGAEALLIMTSRGYIKRMDPGVFAKQRRATRGKRSGKMRGGDAVLKTAHCRGTDAVLFFTDRGRVHAVRAYEIPEASTAALGTPFTRVLQLKEGESITAMLPVEEGSAEDPSEDPSTGPSHLAMVTSRGLIKKTPVAEFASIFKNGKKALNLRVGDRLKHVELLRPGDGIVIGAVDGNVIHVDGDAIRPQGRAASGVKSMAFRFDAKTRDGDAAAERALGEDEDDAGEALPANVAGVAVVPARVVEALDLRNTANANAKGEEDEDEKDDAAEGTGTTEGRDGAREPMLFLLSNQGRGKRIRLATFSQQARAGKGKRAMGLAPGDALAAMCVTGMSPEWAAAEGEGEGGEAAGERGEHVIVGSQNGVLNRLDVESVRPQRGASAKGVAVMKLGEGDVVSVLTLLPAELAE